MDIWRDGHMDSVTYLGPDWSKKLFQYRIFILKYLKDLPPEIQSDLQTFQNQYQLSNNELGIQNKYWFSNIYTILLTSFSDIVIGTILQQDVRFQKNR